MSRLENSVSRIAGPMMQDIAVPLEPEDQALIARWAMLHALLKDYVRPAALNPGDQEPFFSDEDRFNFANQSVIPERTVVWLAAFRGSQTSFSKVSDATLAIGGSQSTVRLTTMTFGPFGAQVGSMKMAPGHADAVVHVHGNPEFNLAVLQIWPLSRGIVRWPPPHVIHGPGGPAAFHARFGLQE